MYFQANILTNIIINYYFNTSNCILILTNKLDPFNYEGELPYVSISADGVTVPRHLIFNYLGCQGFVVIHENPTAVFENLEAEMKLSESRFNYRKYLFLPTRNRLQSTLDVFDSPAVNFVADILAVNLNSTEVFDVFGDEAGVFDLYTHRYVGDENSTNDVIWLDRWYSVNQSFLLNQNLYPDKLKNQYGRALKIVTFTYKPYSIIDPPDGTDLLFTLEFAKKHNMTVEYVVDEKGEWGEVYDNWTGYGILGNLAKDKGDVGLGALYTWEHEYGFFDFSKPVMRSGITCIAPAPRQVSAITTPFLPFSKEMWLIVAVFYLFSTASFYLILSLSIIETQHQNSTAEGILMSFAISTRIFLLQSFQKVPSAQRSRMIFGMALVLSLLLTSIYASGLSSTMTIPRYHGIIRDIDDLVASDIRWGATSTAWIASIESDSRYAFHKLFKAFVVESHDNLAKLNNERFAYAVEHLQAGNFATGNYITLKGAQKRRILDKDMYWEFCVLMMRKSSILLPSMDELVLTVTESGLVYFWENQVVMRYSDFNIQKAIKESAHSIVSSGVRTKLAWKHVQGIFAIWAVGLLISVSVFLVELFNKKKRNI